MGVIYMATNLIDGMLYIGLSKNPWPERKYRHITAANAGYTDHFHSAIRKYGKENFEWQILCECKNEDLNFVEIYFIFAYGTQEPNGYNILSGGSGVYEYKHNNESKEKWYEKMKDRFYPVKCIETQEIYDTSVIAGNNKGIQPSNILKCCKRQRKTAGKLHWCFADEDITIEDIEGNRKGKPGVSQRIICDSLNKIFNSGREAADYFEVSPSLISGACNGKWKINGKYELRFID